jgi:serine/threonine protein kinase
MGAVYLARQERPRRKVAVKVLAQQLTGDPRAWRVFLARFRREADATAALDSANIVPIYEFGEQEGIAYLVMPYLSDGSLAQLLAREGPIQLTRVVRYVEQIAAALDLAHRQGIIHRDVKPSNLLLHPDGRLMLGDFGIARPVDAPELIAAGLGGNTDDPRLTQAGATMGTPEYMAPEQARGESVGPAADIYALGVVAFEMLAGDPPFTGDDVSSVLSLQVQAQPPSVRSYREEVSPRVDEVLAWALAKDPNARPRSAGAFARALREAAQGRSSRTLASSSLVRPPLTREPLGGIEAVDALAASGVHRSFDDYAPVQSADPEDRTVYDGPSYSTHAGGRGFATAATPVASFGGAAPPPGGGAGALPAWPVPGGARTWRGPLLMLAAGGVVALLIIAMAVTLFNQSGGTLFPTSNPNGVLAPVQSVTPLPTATPSPIPSPTATPVANWLVVSPTDISLQCKSGKKSVDVRLSNLGPQGVDWSASSSAFRAVSLQPSSGHLGKGRSTNITVTDTNYFFTVTGTITFSADNGDAGQPAVVAFKASSCLGG